MIEGLDTESPFLRHYGEIRYGRREADVLLRRLVLHLWDRADYPAPTPEQLLSAHGCAEVAQQLQEYHATHGARDKAFVALAKQLAQETWDRVQAD